MFGFLSYEAYNSADKLEQKKEGVNELVVIKMLNISNSALSKCTGCFSFFFNKMEWV